MKRIIIAVTAGIMVFGAALGLAAAITVSTDSLGSGEATVTACTTSVSTSYTLDGSSVTDVVLESLDANCNGADAHVEVLDGTSTVLTSGSVSGVTADGTADVSVPLDDQTQSAEDIESVRVTLNGGA